MHAIPLVTELVSEEDDQVKTEYLLGQEPLWSDIISGKAIKRDIDEDLLQECGACLERDGESSVIVVLGTAGSGKSTSLMRAAWALSAEGVNVGFCDRDIDISTIGLVQAVDRQDDLSVLAIDDAGRYGEALARCIDEMARRRPGCLLLVAMHSSAVERFLPAKAVQNASHQQVVLPGLTDADIDGLIETMERFNRLGILANRNADDRRRAFREHAGRQLLVAMIQATSGKRFEEKIVDEFEDLTERENHLYALIAVATGRNFALDTSEILTASGHPDNEALNHLESLTKRHLLVVQGGKGGERYRVRHREIARVVTEYLASTHQLRDLIDGLAYAAACGVSPVEARSSRSWRFLKSFISHRYLSQVLDIADARFVYGNLEETLKNDHHYWLQRGSLEVRDGELHMAQHFLGTAMSLNDADPLVVTECAYLEMKLAIDNPRSPNSLKRFSDAVEVLEGLIADRGKHDAHPYHVLGSQTLSWSRLGVGDREATRGLLRRVAAHVEEGQRRHPGSRDLEGLAGALRKQLLMTHVD